MPSSSQNSHVSEPDRQKADSARQTLIAACLSGFLFQFDLTAVSAALPDIAFNLYARASDQAWIINIYSLAMIFALPLAGPLADRFGRRRMFIIGISLFALASGFCATTASFSTLLVWRVMHGVGAAMLTVSASALLASAYPGPRRSWAFGIWGTVVGASMIAGPLLGALIAAHLGWPWVFWANVPICALLIIMTKRIADEQAYFATDTPLDWVGPAALAVCVGSLAFLLLAARGTSASSFYSMPLVLAVSASAFLLFVWAERRHSAPAFDFTLFGSPRFTAMCLVAVASSVGFWSLLVHLPQMARGPMALGAGATGLLLTALTVPMFLLPSTGAKLAEKLPKHWYFAGGLAIIGGADLLLAFAARDLNVPTAPWFVVTALLISGTGCALFNAQVTAMAVSAVPPDRAATASAICVTMRQIGFVFGITLIGALLQRSDPMAYTNAFAFISACTFGFAALVFVLLRRSE
ncbi:MAG: MFS transporter [Beijerinckiaceae bacterium]